MRLQFNDDEQAIHDAFATFFAKECPTEVVREAAPLGFCRDLWQKLGETGAPVMAQPENYGGGGANLRELGIVVGLAGSSIAPVPLVEHAVTTRLLARLSAPETDLAQYLISDESAIATLALRPISSKDSTANLLPAGAIANTFVALHGNDLIAVTSPPPLISLANTADLPIANREIANALAVSVAVEHYLADLPIANREIANPVIVLSDIATTAFHFSRAVSEWQALTATAICGLGQRALHIGVDYALERQQFDRPIGSFQAVQHGLADAATELEAAYYLCQRSLWMLDTEAENVSDTTASDTTAQTTAQTFAAMAFLFASEAAQRATAASLHYHGGYGYAEEYDIGLYYRRAKGWSLIYGSPAQEYQRLADTLLGPIAVA